MLNLTKTDRRFLRAVGIAEPSPTTVANEDPTLEFLRAHDLPLTRGNYLAVAYLGNPPKELDPEQEAELFDIVD